MIVWLNGAFGAGKTTTARELAAQEPWLRAFDPEWVGYMLRANLGDHRFSDFQDLPSWRRLVPIVADEVVRFTGQGLIAVQTIFREDYWHEIHGELRKLGHDVLHVLLDADTQALTARGAAPLEAAVQVMRERQARLRAIPCCTSRRRVTR